MGKLVRTFVAVAALSVVTVVSGGVRAGEPASCSLGNTYKVRSVTPYVTFEDAGYTTWEQFRGADVFVPAEPALTSEWLQRVVTYDIAAGRCEFGTRNVTVAVLSVGNGFSVRIGGWDLKAADEILRSARQLVK
jgi:hypothetical protein